MSDHRYEQGQIISLEMLAGSRVRRAIAEKKLEPAPRAGEIAVWISDCPIAMANAFDHADMGWKLPASRCSGD